MTRALRTTFSFAMGIAVALALAATALLGAQRAFAMIAPAPCAGNVCTDAVVVGGQTVNVSYTQHLAPGGTLKVRFNGGAYNTSGLISYIVFNLPAFSSWSKYPNPNNGAIVLPTEDVNPGRTAYERRSNPGYVGIVDQVSSVTYAGLAPGAYAFDISIIQNGDTGGKTYTFYVDAAAPTNMNESNVFASLVGMDYPCADGVDNDLSYASDCADAQCSGSIGQVGTGAKCEVPETTCNDGFDNNGNGLVDCKDPSCDGKVGQPGGTALCQYGNETGASTCGDNFDNDGDGLTDCVDNAWSPVNGGTANSICWKKPAFGCPATEISCTDGIDNDKDQNYSDNYDASGITGVDCTDYDCASPPGSSCPTKENFTVGGVENDALCFDGGDNDLDHKTDCADPDCLGVTFGGKTCREKEFDLGTVGLNGSSYQYCANGLDDNGDDLPGQPGSRTDCNDLSCKQRFGNCGPCPTQEAITYDSCANAKDDDTDGPFDCNDADCTGKVGSLPLGAVCLATENTTVSCSDGFDNDHDGKADCADPDCTGKMGPDNQTCQPAGETTCTDGADNDGDGLIDCADPSCQTGASCASSGSWTAATCQVVPRDTSPTPFTSNNPTVLATVRSATHIGTSDVIHLQGSGTYTSVTVIAGDNTDPASYYPYASSGCVVSGPTAARFSFSAIAGHAVQLFNTAGPAINTFDITLTCAVGMVPAAVKNYPLSLSALKSGGNPEYGDLAESTTLYEATAPVVTAIEPEGVSGGTVRVPYGGTLPAAARRMRGIPNDPGGASPLSTGICKCDVTVGGTPYTTGSDCTTPAIAFLADTSLTLSATAQDGAGNVSGTYNAPNVAINVTPVLESGPGGPLAITPAKPFFKTGKMDIGIDSRFLTGASDTFTGCELWLWDASGNNANGFGPITTFPGIAPGFGNGIRCVTTFTLPGTLADGTYTATVKAIDSDGDSAMSNRQVFYVCNAVPQAGDPPGTNGCQYADFDGDGAAEGLYTTLYSTTALACDNCVNMANPLQEDTNANGIGDLCEPTENFGRCEIDTDIVCKYPSDDVGHGCPAGALCCPGPSIKDVDPVGAPGVKKDPQLCKPDWCVCSFDGKIAFNDAQCTGVSNPASPLPGYGLCQDNATTCKHDVDCGAVAGTPHCTDPNICANLLNPWLQTQQGSVFSQKRITSTDAPPAGQFNATFCIVGKELVQNFTSASGCVSQDSSTALVRPQASNAYATVLGKLDLAGLRAGKYGAVTTIDGTTATLDATLDSLAGRLGGRVIRVTGNASVSARSIMNGLGSGTGSSGTGTVFVDGGDLTIHGDIAYDASAAAALDNLASIGWIAVPSSGGSGGNVYVDGTVHNVVGAIYAGGGDGFWTVTPPLTDSTEPFTLHGLVVAKSFHLGRSFKSKTQGSEQFIYDGRAVANPPPGFADVTKSLPLFTDVLPQ
ncbi:MAG: hypothetical protein RLZZ324_669 [Candidatus Parcubacteria bacterium]|jgi:hypothetical protein